MNSNTHNLVGKILDQYMLEQCIKHSKMSTVYRARQLHLARHVAVKVMNSGLDNEFLLRFRREARVMVQLEHANIIPIYDYGEQEGLTYLVMPYFPKGSLHDVLIDRGRLSQQETFTYIQQAAAALDYAHMYGIVHLDLKPSNFLLHADGRLVLTDFGIARITHNTDHANGSVLTNKGSLLGTPEYMPPEMILGEQIDYRADIYELGIVLYQLLSGYLPFRGNSSHAILIKHLQEFPLLLHQIDETIPPEVDTVVRRAIAKKREERYPSAKLLAHALQAASTPPAYSMVIDQPSSTSVLTFINSSRIQTAATMLEEHLAPVPHSPAKDAAFEPKEVYSVRSNIKPFRIFMITLMTIAFLICILFTCLVPTLVPQEPSQRAFAQQPRPTPIASTTPSQEAADAVRRYYATWNSYDYLGTYNQLESQYRRTHPFSTLIGSYENTLHSSIMINGVTELPNGVFKVAITDFATEKDSSGTQKVNRIYYGYYIVKKENGVWRLTPYFKY